MKFHKQLSLTDKEKEISGSCYPTVIACILDKEIYEVPNFHLFYLGETATKNSKIVFTNLYLDNRNWNDADQYQKDNHDRYWSLLHNHWHNTLVWWLATQGYKETIIPTEKYEKWLLKNPKKPYLVRGVSPRSITHVVIYIGGKMVHDPHPSDGGLITLHEQSPYSFLEKII